MRITRRRFVQAAAVTSAFTSVNILQYPADAAEFTYKYGNNVPPTYPMNVRVRAASDRIREMTSGRFDLQVFPNGQLGTDTDMLSQVRSGAIHFYTASGLVLSTLVPVTAINALGFAFNDYSQVWPAMDGELGAHLRGAIVNSGLYPMRKIFDIGFRETTSSTHPINTPDDFKGFKVRIPVSQLGVSMFKALGASPATINFSEVYTALQTHVVDGQENPLSIIDTGKLFEVQKYCSMTNHMWDGFWFLGNRRAWERLPKDIQEIVENELSTAAEADRQDIASLDGSLKGELEKKGLVFNSPDTAPFRLVLQKSGFYAEWRKQFGEAAWGLLEKYVGQLG
jgi:tripartite ATP-independent transporter DctP family solute receptor